MYVDSCKECQIGLIVVAIVPTAVLQNLLVKLRIEHQATGYI